jgi:hypothetical protein
MRDVEATDTRLAQRLQEIGKLDATERRQIIQIFDTFIERGKVKQRISTQEANHDDRSDPVAR